MLRRKALRKIIITTFSIITIFMICIIPDRINSNDNFLNPKIDTIYVTNANTNEIYLLGNNNYLVKTNIVLSEEDLESRIKSIIDYLTVNKSSKIPNGLNGIIPEDTKLNNIEINDKIVTLDFSNSLLNVSKEIEERLIESITYSLINLDGIEGIMIKIDGNILKELPNSKKVLPQVLNRSFGINKVFEIDNINDIQKVTMYYIDKIDNSYYYVPVTRYLNDDREKIKIIIDNLSSNYIYETSLLSLLSKDIELINYEIEDNMMKLNFNQDIFNNNKLLEEVAYPISSSVFDNYSVDSVLFQVNGSDISIIEKCCGIKNIED